VPRRQWRCAGLRLPCGSGQGQSKSTPRFAGSPASRRWTRSWYLRTSSFCSSVSGSNQCLVMVHSEPRADPGLAFLYICRQFRLGRRLDLRFRLGFHLRLLQGLMPRAVTVESLLRFSLLLLQSHNHRTDNKEMTCFQQNRNPGQGEATEYGQKSTQGWLNIHPLATRSGL
jgi:hypothetical protein